jgi:hypothetical protein
VRIVLTRLRLLITSVFREMGLGRPCSLRKRPQALHRTEPNSSRLHSGVVDVLQFWHVGCECVLVAIMVPVKWTVIATAADNEGGIDNYLS